MNFETKLDALDTLFEIAKKASKKEYKNAFKATMTPKLIDCIVDGVFRIKTTMTDEEVDKVISSDYVERFKQPRESSFQSQTDDPDWSCALIDIEELFTDSSVPLQ